LRYSKPADANPGNKPSGSDFMKSLNKRIEGLKKGK